ncbi:hypothetical protein Pint_09503 [Pistacia integerrima]|uniref:Uncharacterized protein n=1 Tax=Pistacia integerrima TaxID=434235 RepID=A0ACC0XFM5_9ROSI|nr:hypothetical protein Pint_09503 [Pistacia integerrima]
MERSDTSMALAMKPVLGDMSNIVVTALKDEAQFAVDFYPQLDEMKTKLDFMKGFLSTYNLRNHGDVFRPLLHNMRNLIYEADDILTDCQLREEYRKHGSSARSRKFSPRGLKFITRGQCYDDGLETEGRKILEKCGGLPLAIKTMGALLAPKVDSPSQWEEIGQDFHQLATQGDNTASVTASLELSYDDLPDHLKSCLLCFSIFPEDFTIHAEQIVIWWVGEGLILGDETKTAIELGYEYLSQLANRCLIEVENRRGYDGMIYSCKMHDLVRDMTIDIAKDEAFGSFDEQCN